MSNIRGPLYVLTAEQYPSQEADPHGIIQGGLTGGILNGATTEEIDYVANLSRKPLQIISSNPDRVLTSSDFGKTVGINAGSTSSSATLPAATGSGGYFDVIVRNSITGGATFTLKVANSSDTIKGISLGRNNSDNTIWMFNSASGTDAFRMNGTTTGGANRGLRVRIIDVAANVWVAIVFGNDHSTTPATPWAELV